MRNCFVPFCDAHCKATKCEKRMMFIPPREPMIFSAWKRRLYNKRTFRAKDKVCERHFEKDQILTHWDHIIDGVVVQLQRDKPKLMPTAIPTLNLPEMCPPSDTDDEAISEMADHDVSQKSTALTEKNVNVQKQQVADNVEIGNTNQPKRRRRNNVDDIADIGTDDLIVHIPTPDNHDSDTALEEERARQAIFESIYDDIYEVVLPSTLWGIHRDPERKFIVFSEFDVSTMDTAKLLHISDTCQLKAFIHKIEVELAKRDQLSVELLTETLGELDDITQHVNDAC